MAAAVSGEGRGDRERRRQPPVHEYVAEQLRREIALGLFRPRSSLPPERELASIFGVGIMTVHRAIRLLEADALVTSKRGRGGGTFVVGGARDADATRQLRARAARSRQAIEEALDARLELEPRVVARAARHAGRAGPRVPARTARPGGGDRRRRRVHQARRPVPRRPGAGGREPLPGRRAGADQGADLRRHPAASRYPDVATAQPVRARADLRRRGAARRHARGPGVRPPRPPLRGQRPGAAALPVSRMEPGNAGWKLGG